MQSAGIDAVILAGGAGRRIGGDKAFVRLAGRPLFAHVLARLSPQVDALAINAGPDPRLANIAPGLEVLPDAAAGIGPLAGVLAALDWGASRGAVQVLTVPVDTPFLPGDLVARLARSDAPGAYARTPDGAQGTTALWPVAGRAALAAAVARGTRKVTDALHLVGAAPVEFAAAEDFANLNTAEDVARAEERMRR